MEEEEEEEADTVQNLVVTSCKYKIAVSSLGQNNQHNRGTAWKQSDRKMQCGTQLKCGYVARWDKKRVGVFNR